MKPVYTVAALHDLSILSKPIAARILTKMEWFCDQDEPLAFAKKLTDTRLGTHRFRVGNYRVLVDHVRGHLSILTVLAVRHRKDAYRL